MYSGIFKVIEPNQQDGSFKLRYTLFGNPTDIDLQALENNCYLIDEKITIKFRSTLRMLKSYLKAKFTVPIEVLWMDSSIGEDVELKSKSLQLFTDEFIWFQVILY